MKKIAVLTSGGGAPGMKRGHSKRDTDGGFSALVKSWVSIGGTRDFWKRISGCSRIVMPAGLSSAAVRC